MPQDEIKVPKELREFMPDGAEETFFGQKNGARKQYRYGNLHIREYDDKFLVHTDKIDPRTDPMGHLVKDAPEFLVGLACGLVGGTQAAKILRKKPNRISIPATLLSSLVTGYVGYATAKRIKNYLE